MKKLTVIVCNNGLGHIKRVFWILRLLDKKYTPGVQANIFVDLDKLNYFPPLTEYFKKSNCQVKFFDIKAQNSNYENKFVSKYANYLKSADYVWSDNLIFPLKYRKEVFLTGSFLWLDILKDASLIRREKDMLLRAHPIMIANKYFATPNVKKLTSFFAVSMYEYSYFQIPGKISNKILISCGRSRPAKAHFDRQISHIYKEIKTIPDNVEIYIEPDYHKNFSGIKNIRKATFTEKMFSGISSAVIRPGLGTVSEVLLKGARICSFYEEDNYEIKYNAKILRSLNVGEDSGNIPKALRSAVKYLCNKNLQKKHLKYLKKLSFNGLGESTDKIISILN